MRLDQDEPTAPMPEIEALRGLAVVGVVGLHVSFGYLIATPGASATVSPALFVALLSSFGAPLFVALSMTGLALGHRELRGFGPDYLTFLGRRARRILPAYVFWTLLTIARTDPGSLRQVGAVAAALTSGSAAYHFYFVPLICEYYVLWPLLAAAARAAWRGPRAAVAVALAGLVVSLGAWLAASRGALAATPLTLPLFWCGYAALGIAGAPALVRLFRARAWSLPRLPVAILFGVTALGMLARVRATLGAAPDRATIAIAITIFQPGALPYTIAAMVLGVVLVDGGARGGRWLQMLGRRSYGVYLAHVLVLEVVLYRVFGRPPSSYAEAPLWWLAMLAEWIACLALTALVIATLERIPGLAAFAGGRAPAIPALTAPPPPP